MHKPLTFWLSILFIFVQTSLLPHLATAQQRSPFPQISGIYPHLAYYNEEGECGTGAVVP